MAELELREIVVVLERPVRFRRQEATAYFPEMVGTREGVGAIGHGTAFRRGRAIDKALRDLARKAPA
jgi:hypothetical protein